MQVRRTRGIATAAVGLAVFCAVPRADASPGDHIRVGDALITPSVMTGFEYHSNVYLVYGEEKEPTAAPAWVLSPALQLELDGKKIQLTFGAGYNLKKFIDLKPNDAINVQNADRFTDFTSTFGMNALSKGLVGIHLDNRFEIQNVPNELGTGKENANTVHTSEDANGGLTLRPGSALEIGVLGNVGADAYYLPVALRENGEANVNNRASYGPIVNAKWHFLPKTSLLGSVSLGWTHWQNNLVYSIGPEGEGANFGDYIGKPNALAWRTMWGVRGQFTDKLAAGLELGFGQMYYDENSVIENAPADISSSSAELEMTGEETFATDLTTFPRGFLVNALVAYAPVRGQTVTLGYKKDFQDAFFTNYVAFNYLFLRYQGLFAERFGLSGELTYRIDNFHGEVARDDQDLTVKLGGAYRFNDYLSTGLTGGWNRRACLQSDCQDAFYSTQYDDFWAQLGVTFTY